MTPPIFFFFFFFLHLHYPSRNSHLLQILQNAATPPIIQTGTPYPRTLGSRWFASSTGSPPLPGAIRPTGALRPSSVRAYAHEGFR